MCIFAIPKPGELSEKKGTWSYRRSKLTVTFEDGETAVFLYEHDMQIGDSDGFHKAFLRQLDPAEMKAGEISYDRFFEGGRGDNPDPAPFYEETGLEAAETHFIEPADFLRITNGSFPVILLMNGPEIRQKYNYRNLH